MLPITQKLPPTQRDFEIYHAVHIAGCSTWSQAAKYHVSQTRVRQIVRRVVEWLADVLPPQTEVAKEQEIHLARQIAADRFQYQLEQMTELWNETKASKYAGLRMRLTVAQARLGVVGGRLDALAADAIDGLPVPVWTPPEIAVHESSSPPASAVGWEMVAPAAAAPPTLESTTLAAPPPPGDFSTPNELPTVAEAATNCPTTGTHATPATCDASLSGDPPRKLTQSSVSQPLLTASVPLHITQLQLTSNQLGIPIAAHSSSASYPPPPSS